MSIETVFIGSLCFRVAGDAFAPTIALTVSDDRPRQLPKRRIINGVLKIDADGQAGMLRMVDDFALTARVREHLSKRYWSHQNRIEPP